MSTASVDIQQTVAYSLPLSLSLFLSASLSALSLALSSQAFLEMYNDAAVGLSEAVVELDARLTRVEQRRQNIHTE